MQFVDKGKPPKGQQYLRCANGYRSFGCERYSIRYDECEALILNNCTRLKPEQVLPNPDEQAQRCQKLQQQIDGKAAELDDIESKLENFAGRVGEAPSDAIAKRIYIQMAQLEAKQSDLREQMKDDERKLADAEHDAKSIRHWTKTLKELREAIAEDGAAQLRMRLRLHLQDFITKIEIFANGYQTESDQEADHKGARLVPDEKGRLKYIPAPMPTEDDFYEAMEAQVSEQNPELWDDKMFQKFMRHIAEQRLTKNGRFVRVHFKTKAAVVDLVPDGSLASGMELVQDKRRRAGWRFVRPKLARMWRDFMTEYKRKNGTKRT
jgi:hypothetical protein